MLMSIFSYAGTTPPAAVLNAFKTKFPNATEVKWGMENKTEYEAEFTLDGKKISANFKTDGSWVETETGVAQKDLPAGVMDYINKNYAGAKVNETAKIEMPDKTVYEVEVKGKSVLFDLSGKFLSESKED